MRFYADNPKLRCPHSSSALLDPIVLSTHEKDLAEKMALCFLSEPDPKHKLENSSLTPGLLSRCLDAPGWKTVGKDQADVEEACKIYSAITQKHFHPDNGVKLYPTILTKEQSKELSQHLTNVRDDTRLDLSLNAQKFSWKSRAILELALDKITEKLRKEPAAKALMLEREKQVKVEQQEIEKDEIKVEAEEKAAAEFFPYATQAERILKLSDRKAYFEQKLKEHMDLEKVRLAAKERLEKSLKENEMATIVKLGESNRRSIDLNDYSEQSYRYRQDLWHLDREKKEILYALQLNEKIDFSYKAKLESEIKRLADKLGSTAASAAKAEEAEAERIEEEVKNKADEEIRIATEALEVAKENLQSAKDALTDAEEEAKGISVPVRLKANAGETAQQLSVRQAAEDRRAQQVADNAAIEAREKLRGTFVGVDGLRQPALKTDVANKIAIVNQQEKDLIALEKRLASEAKARADARPKDPAAVEAAQKAAAEAKAKAEAAQKAATEAAAQKAAAEAKAKAEAAQKAAEAVRVQQEAEQKAREEKARIAAWATDRYRSDNFEKEPDLQKRREQMQVILKSVDALVDDKGVAVPAPEKAAYRELLEKGISATYVAAPQVATTPAAVVIKVRGLYKR